MLNEISKYCWYLPSSNRIHCCRIEVKLVTKLSFLSILHLLNRCFTHKNLRNLGILLQVQYPNDSKVLMILKFIFLHTKKPFSWKMLILKRLDIWTILLCVCFWKIIVQVIDGKKIIWALFRWLGWLECHPYTKRLRVWFGQGTDVGCVSSLVRALGWGFDPKSGCTHEATCGSFSLISMTFFLKSITKYPWMRILKKVIWHNWAGELLSLYQHN